MAIKNSVATTGRTVSDEIAAMSTLASVGLSVHPERCVRLRNRHSSCSRCADACTSGAISLTDGAWRMTPDLCVGCGTCATVCPTCALEAQHPNDAALLKRARESARMNQGQVVVACHKAIEDCPSAVSAQGVVQVICLSRLEETSIFTLLAQGATGVVAVHGDCADCPRHQGRQSIDLVQRTVDTIEVAWGLDVDYQVTDEFPAFVLGGEDATADAEDAACYTHLHEAGLAEGESVSLSQQGHIEASFKPVHVQKDGTLPHFVPSRRAKLLDALAKLGQPQGDATMDTRLWGHVIINFDLCKSCKMCAVFCPTGAISKYSDEHGVAGIEHYIAECVHCCLCQDICPARAIYCTTEVPVGQLASGETERYKMADPDWMAGPDQILQRMRTKIGGNSVEHSY